MKNQQKYKKKCTFRKRLQKDAGKVCFLQASCGRVGLLLRGVGSYVCMLSNGALYEAHGSLQGNFGDV